MFILSLSFSLLHIALLSILHSTRSVVATTAQGGNPEALFAQIVINNQQYRIETPQLSMSGAEQQAEYFHPSDTCIPFVGDTYYLTQPIDVDSVTLTGGPPGFGFVLWSDFHNQYISGTVNWNNPTLIRPPIPWQDDDNRDPNTQLSQGMLMPQATRIIWWIREDPSNTFVAVAQYADENADVSFGTERFARERDYRERFPVETRLIDFVPPSMSSIDWFYHGRERVGRWKVSSLYEGKKVIRLAVPELPTNVPGPGGGSSDEPAVPQLPGDVPHDDSSGNDSALENTFTELRCFAVGRWPWQKVRKVWPDRSLFVEDKSINDLVCCRQAIGAIERC